MRAATARFARSRVRHDRGLPLPRPPVRKWRLPAVAILAAVAVTPAARADVLEISANGAVTRIAGPVTVNEEGISPIAAPPAIDPHLLALAPRFAAAGRDAALSPRLIEAVAWAESRFNQSARSPAGAEGMMQLMPGTAAALGVDPADADQNLRGGAAYFRQMLDLFENDLVLALAAYNAGPDAVRRHGGVPPYGETQAYVAAVLGYLADSVEQESAP